MTQLPAIPDPWRELRKLTAARIALGRAGGSLPTHECLDFNLGHAQARDAVHSPFDAEGLGQQIAALGVDTVLLASAAPDRASYLKRPDLGRRLDHESTARLAGIPKPNAPFDLAVVVSDGLSALASHRQAPALLVALLPLLRGSDWRVAPVAIVRYGRVAIEDEVGQLLGARLALILLGERPGLNAPDSLGAYLVFDPRPGRTDAERNCVSNIRPEGLPIEAAAQTIYYLLNEARGRRQSGIGLKDERPRIVAPSLDQRLP